MITNFFKQSFPLLKLLAYLSLLYFLGLIKGIVLCFVLHKFYNFLMLKLFKLEPFSPGDKLFVFNPVEEDYNLMGFLTFEDDYDVESMKTHLIEKGLKQFKKLRSIQEYKFFDFWWKELPIEECLGKYNPFQIMRNKRRFDTAEDIVNYSYEELAVRFDFTKELPYKFILIKNDEGVHKNVLVIKFDHLLTDGIGFIGMITALGENYDLKLFPPSMKKHSLTFPQLLLAFVTLPYLIIYPAYQNLLGLRSGDTPFKSKKPISGIPFTAISADYPFNEFAKINKRLKITFNDMMMSAFSAAIKKYCKENYHTVPNQIITITPVGNRGLPENPLELKITNDSSAVACPLKLIDDPVKECKVISREFAKNVRNIPLYKVVKFLADFLSAYGPYYLGKWVFKTSSKNFDITFSNVACPKELLVYNGVKVTNIYPLMTPGFTYALVGLYTYAGKFRWTICLDKILEFDPNVLIKYVDEQLIAFKSASEEQINSISEKVKEL